MKLAAMEGRECATTRRLSIRTARGRHTRIRIRSGGSTCSAIASCSIGDDFWDLIGGSGTWEAMIGIAQDVGAEYESRIRRDYLFDD